jgi:hypothetical protein
VWEVLPATAEEEDVNQAKVATKFLDAKWRELEMEEAREEFVMWLLTCGTAFIKTWWDPEKYADENMVAMTDEEGNEVKDDNGQVLYVPRQLEDGRLAPIGDLDACVVSPFEIIPDPDAANLKECRWIIHAKKWPLEVAESKWNVKLASEVDESNPFDKAKGMLKKLWGKSQHEPSDEDGVIVKEMWERPSKKHPQGRLVIVAGEKLIADGPNPMPDGELPFIMAGHYVVPGRFWRQAVVQHLISPQKQFNKTRSQITEIKNRTANPQKLIPVNSSVDESKWTGEPGLNIRYNPLAGAKPEYIQPPSVPSYVFKELENLLYDLDQISGQHEVSHGQTPPGVKSGIAIRYLQEQDDTKLGPTVRNLEKAWKRLAKMWLKMAREYYDPQEARMVKHVGKNNEVAVEDFHAAEMPMEPDVIVVSGSSLPESKAARQEFLKELYGMGVFVDPKTGQNDNQRFLKMLEIGGTEEAFDDISADLNAAEMENRYAMEGREIAVHEWDNHKLHIYDHNKERKGTNFANWPQEAKEILGRHIKIHEAALSGAIPWTYSGEVDVQMLQQQFQMSQQMTMMPGAAGPGAMTPPGPAQGPAMPGGMPAMPQPGLAGAGPAQLMSLLGKTPPAANPQGPAGAAM